ncbi:hypothetical protein [Carboxylicivirga taeanensis]|uniref:hypothetical protein n=1 Tax=Carboxylicivirga taeanensis TaxID=1416875 RepID=UPI003F6E04E8
MKHILLLLAIYSGCQLMSISQEQTKPVYPSLFASDELLTMSLYFDVTSHIRKKSEEYCPSKVVFYFSEEDSAAIDVRCRARGNFRRDNCHFPPVMLNFKPDTLFTTDGYLTKVKLVTHCIDNKTYREYMLEEYLIYKLWEQVSPYALRTRLCDIYYFDRGKKGKNYRALGFMLEPVRMMAERTNTIEVKGEYFKEHEINALDADRVALFNYMIGNTDWRIKGGHNILFIKRFGYRREEVTAIPYDFDHAGFVNAAYAKPAEWSRAKQVTERDYTGRCRDYDDNYYQLIDEFVAVEEGLYEIILNFEYLDLKHRKQLLRYLEDFFERIKKPDAFIRTIRSSCMNRY